MSQIRIANLFNFRTYVGFPFFVYIFLDVADKSRPHEISKFLNPSSESYFFFTILICLGGYHFLDIFLVKKNFFDTFLVKKKLLDTFLVKQHFLDTFLVHKKLFWYFSIFFVYFC